jgi:hypothetical protein
VSRVRWQNTYSFGDFHGSVDTLLKYYDAHFYVANWGTVRLDLAFPKGAIAPDAIQPYGRGSTRSCIRRLPRPTTKWPPNCRNRVRPMPKPVT